MDFGNKEAEKSVIGSVLLDASKVDEVVWLEPKDFQFIEHALIWKAIQHLYQSNKHIDVVTITEDLHKYKRLDEIGGVMYLQEILNATLTTANIKNHADIVRSHALKRRAYDIGQQISELVDQPFEDNESLFSEMERLASSVRPEAQGDLVDAKDSEEEVFESLDKEDDLIKTGFKQFDEWAGGLVRGWLYVLAARPSVGKTAKMLQMIRGIASQEQGQCLVWSQEMKRTSLYNRMLSSATGIPLDKFRRKTLTPQEKEIARKVYQKEIAPIPIRIADAKAVTIDEIKAAARQVRRKHGNIAAIFVDYLGIMNIPQPPGVTRQQAIGKVTRGAKQLAIELDCVFILLAQMNREGKKFTRPALEHLRESGDIEQDADFVEFLWVDPEDNHQIVESSGTTIVRSIVAKGRDVGVSQFRYSFYGPFQQFHELPPLTKG